jgi:hypothetical protein
MLCGQTLTDVTAIFLTDEAATWSFPGRGTVARGF